MKLELAICTACTETGCQIVTVNDNSPIEAVYSSKVKDRVKIQPTHLVAINTETKPPTIMWRWIRGAVIEINDNVTVVGDMGGHPGEVIQVPELPLKLKVDDEVWVCGTGQNYEIHDLIIEGKPVHPKRILEYITPIIEDIYNGKKN